MIRSTALMLSVLILGSAVSGSQAETRALRAILNNSSVISGGTNGSTSPSTGTADLLVTWDPADTSTATLSYDITVTADLDGTQTPDLNDDVTAIHFHNLDECVSATCLPGDTAGTKHVLNAFGVPRNDDGDMRFFPAEGRVTGLWDATDANDLTPAPSFAPVDSLEQILNGELFLMVHTREFPAGAFGGLAVVPEPTSAGLLLMASTLLMGWRR